VTRAVDIALTLRRMTVVGFWHIAIAVPSVLLVLLLPNGGAIGHALFARFWGRVTLAMSGVRLDVTGAGRVDPRARYVFVVNHASEFDFYAVAAVLPHQWRALMRPGLGRIPVYGWIARRTGHVFISLRESNTHGRAFGAAMAQLAAGRSLLVFPEGRRSHDGRLRPFKTGAFLLAIEAGVPVVPIAVEEILAAPRRRVLGRGFAHRIRRLRVVVGDPIATDGLGKDDIPALRDRAEDTILRAHVGDVERADAFS